MAAADRAEGGPVEPVLGGKEFQWIASKCNYSKDL